MVGAEIALFTYGSNPPIMDERVKVLTYRDAIHHSQNGADLISIASKDMT